MSEAMQAVLKLEDTAMFLLKRVGCMLQARPADKERDVFNLPMSEFWSFRFILKGLLAQQPSKTPIYPFPSSRLEFQVRASLLSARKHARLRIKV